jgi:protein SCO1
LEASLLIRVALFASLFALSAVAAEIPQELKNAGITEHLGAQIGLQDVKLRDETGVAVTLDKYFQSGRPVVLNLVYYRCSGLCNYILNGFTDTLKDTDWTPGKQFEVVTVSIDHRETHVVASQKKENYLKLYGRPEAGQGWHFLTGDEAEVRKLAEQVGFGYEWNEKEKQFAHSAAIFVLTPQGKLSRYLYGIQYKPKDFRLALLEASNGKIGTVVDRLLMFCYRYDAHTRGYSLYITKLMQASSAGSVVVMGTYLGVFWRRQRRIYLKESQKNV